MSGRDIIVVGASAGGVEALKSLVAGLPHGFAASLFVVVHVIPTSASHLPEILNRSGLLPAVHAQDGEPIRRGCIYIAPPDYHMLLERDVMRLSHGPPENFTRPAIDPLFRSAAKHYGSRVIGVVLSGALSDGTAGLISIKRQGGLAIVQAPDDALFPSMPKSAISADHPDYILPISEIPSTLVILTTQQPIHEQTDLRGANNIQ